jgi:hypothetical protein
MNKKSFQQIIANSKPYQDFSGDSICEYKQENLKTFSIVLFNDYKDFLSGIHVNDELNVQTIEEFQELRYYPL